MRSPSSCMLLARLPNYDYQVMVVPPFFVFGERKILAVTGYELPGDAARARAGAGGADVLFSYLKDIHGIYQQHLHRHHLLSVPIIIEM